MKSTFLKILTGQKDKCIHFNNFFYARNHFSNCNEKNDLPLISNLK